MPDPQTQHQTETPPSLPPRVRLPGIATAFFIMSPFFLFIGGITYLSTSVRDYFERAATQATVGIVIFMIGLLLLLTATIVACMRSIAQQQVNILLPAELD